MEPAQMTDSAHEEREARRTARPDRARTRQVETDDSGTEFLYRYFAKRWAESLLLNGKIFFPCPADFNDPFDCQARLTFEGSRLKLRRYARDLLKELAPEQSKRDRKRLAAKVNKSSYERAREGFLNSLQTGVGVLSFSEKKANILMWGHYAQSHTGLCIEFRRAEFLDYVLKVKYVEDYPTLKFFEAIEDMESPKGVRRVVDHMFLSKAQDWQYENEWRLLSFPPTLLHPFRAVAAHPAVPHTLLVGGRGLRDFPPNLITGVILGCRMTDEDKAEVRDWIARGPTNPGLHPENSAEMR
jgi:hypothetical protein